MANEQNRPKRHDYLDKLETGRKLSQEVLDAIKAKDQELFEVMETSNKLRDSKLVKPDPNFVKSSQVRLFYRVVEPRQKKFAPLQSLKEFFATITYNRSLKLSPVYSALLVIILSFTILVGGVQASDSAGPGDFLYPMDLAVENIWLSFTHSAESKMRLRLAFSDERLEEAEAAYGESDTENAEIALLRYEAELTAINQLRDTESENISEELLLIADEALKNNTTVLMDLLDQVPEAAQDAIMHAIDASSSTKTPPGQDEDFTPPGQEDKDTPPGQEDKDTPPGQEDKDKDTPPGQEDKDTPPGQEDKEKKTPPGLEDKGTPPGLEDKVEKTPPGLDKE